MRKLIKFMITSVLTTSFSLQAVACSDNSQYNSFLSEVSNTETNNSAFFGFLGSKNNEVSRNLQTTFDLLNEKTNNTKSRWEKWNENNQSMLSQQKLSDIKLLYYQGPSQEDSNNDATTAFWNDKNISWQRNIFNWINNLRKSANNPNPISNTAVSPINTKKDSNDNEMFTKLPIVFIISQGKLITAGENWINNSSLAEQEAAISEFIKTNLFLPAH